MSEWRLSACATTTIGNLLGSLAAAAAAAAAPDGCGQDGGSQTGSAPQLCKTRTNILFSCAPGLASSSYTAHPLYPSLSLSPSPGIGCILCEINTTGMSVTLIVRRHHSGSWAHVFFLDGNHHSELDCS